MVSNIGQDWSMAFHVQVNTDLEGFCVSSPLSVCRSDRDVVLTRLPFDDLYRLAENPNVVNQTTQADCVTGVI